MKSSKVNTKYNNRNKVRNLSAVIAMVLAGITLFQAGTANSHELNREVSVKEAQLLAEIETFMEMDEMEAEEALYFEIEDEQAQSVQVFDANNELIASGDPSQDETLRKLVNQADYLSQFGDKEYYRLAE